MSTEMRIRLGNPGLIFIYSLALLLIGSAIGMHCHHSCITTFWISVLGAALVVVHDIISGLIWFVFTALWIRSTQGSDGNAK
jgi:hypothetical protein